MNRHAPLDYSQLAPFLSLQDLVESKLPLIPLDIRSLEEFTVSHFKNSINFPVKKDVTDITPLNEFRGQYLVIISKTVAESIQVASNNIFFDHTLNVNHHFFFSLVCECFSIEFISLY